ncbi:NAD-dependent deacylase, partial [Prolixibacteraceae bacterium]|nr:NAD-dependent deacylase [Prolixibacteraceae bacterium]
KSTRFPELIYELGPEDLDVEMGDLCEKGFQLRPNIVWFGEAVPMMDLAIDLVNKADIVLVVGTSLSVYPAASLVNYVQIGVPVYLVDPMRPENLPTEVKFICASASEGISMFYKLISQK